MSSGGKLKTAGQWQNAGVTRKLKDEYSSEITAIKAKHVTKLPKVREQGDARGSSPEAGYLRRKGMPSHVPPSWPGFHGTFHSAALEGRKSTSPGIKQSPPRQDPALLRRRSSSESRVSGSSGVKSPKHSEPRFDGSYSYVFPDRSSPNGVPTPRGSAQKTFDSPGEIKGRGEITGALGRAGSDASEVQSPLREPDLATHSNSDGEPDLAREVDLKASLRQDLMEKPLSFSDTMGLKWLPAQKQKGVDEHSVEAAEPWAQCRDEGPWSIAAGRAALPDTGESFTFPEVLPREVLRFAEAPLKPLPEWEEGECGPPGCGGGPLEQSRLHNRQQESFATGSPPLPRAAAEASPASLHNRGFPQIPSPARSPVQSLSPAQSIGSAAGSAQSAAWGRSPAASGGGRERSRERSLSPEPGNFVRNPGHPLNAARSPWSAGLEAYATQLSDSCPRQPPGSCRPAPRSAPRPRTPAVGSASEPRPACRSLREQFEASYAPAANSNLPASDSQCPPHPVQLEAENPAQVPELASAGGTDAAGAATPVRPAATAQPASPGAAAAAARALLGSAGKALRQSLSDGLRGCGGLSAVAGLGSLAGQGSGAAAAAPHSQEGTPAKLAQRATEGASAVVAMAAAAGLALQQCVRGRLVAWRGMRTRKLAAAEDSTDSSFPSAAQIADAVTEKVVRKQVAFLFFAFILLSATALLPGALMLARLSAAAAAAAARDAAAAPVPDSNDYTCLGLPWLPAA